MRNLNEIRKIGMDALLKALGPIDTVKFIQQYDRGHGDYTKERQKLFKDLTVDSIFKEIENKREQN